MFLSMTERHASENHPPGHFRTFRRKCVHEVRGLWASASQISSLPEPELHFTVRCGTKWQMQLLYLNSRWDHDQEQKDPCCFPYIPKSCARLAKVMPQKCWGNPSSNIHRQILKAEVKEQWKEIFFFFQKKSEKVVEVFQPPSFKWLVKPSLWEMGRGCILPDSGPQRRLHGDDSERTCYDH